MSGRIRTFLRSLVLLLACVALAGPLSPEVAAGETTLAVPFLPQTEALCGGAAAAMVYRFWGDLHADVQQFATLVERRAGGIRDTALVAAIRDKGWTASASSGSIATLRAELDAKRPVILLIEDRPGRYHFVVAVGLTDAEVIVHDPTWGPNRRVPLSALMRAWLPTRTWMLVVTPPPGGPPVAGGGESPNTPAASPAPPSSCDRLLDAALDDIDARGLGAADTALNAVRQQCPTAPGPIRELAGVRLAQSRAHDAATLSLEALRLDGNDRYAWDVLGSSLFLQSDVRGALNAWNRIDRPQLDSVAIAGLTRARYALVASALGLTPNTLLTARDFALAERRLAQLPDRVTSRLGLTPSADGFATVHAVVQETARRPQSRIEWGIAGLQTIIDRQLTATIAGGTGQGEVWSGSWRFWENRPRIAAGFAAPRAGRFGGVWRIDGAWEAQTYARGGAGALREDRRTGMLSVRNWLTPSLRYELRAGVDVWHRETRTLITGVTFETRTLGDRLSLQGSADRWNAFGQAADFFSVSALASFRSSLNAHGLVATATVRADSASDRAPLALWSGAGEGRARPALLRAHRLLHRGIVDGPVFGRSSGSTNLELQRWFTTRVAAVAVAVFTDMAGARDRFPGTRGRALQIDAGIGLRARAPGYPGTLRLDYGRGVIDDGQRISAGWTTGN